MRRPRYIAVVIRVCAALLILVALVTSTTGSALCSDRCGMECCTPSPDTALSSGRDCCEVKATTPPVPTPAGITPRSAAADRDPAALAPVAQASHLSLQVMVPVATQPDEGAPPGTAPLFLLHAALLI